MSHTEQMDIEAFRKVVTSRRSVKRFTEKPIPEDVLQDCLDMAMLAPNSSNLQPWEFYLIRSADKREAAIKACLNQNAARTSQVLIAIIARSDTWREHSAKTLQEWPVNPTPGIVTRYYTKVTSLNFTLGPLNLLGPLKWGLVRLRRLRGIPTPEMHYRRDTIRQWAVKSTALAAENLMLALRAHGFDSCPMEGFDPVIMRKVLGLNKHQHIAMMLGAGERAEDGIYHPQFRFERERFIKEV